MRKSTVTKGHLSRRREKSVGTVKLDRDIPEEFTEAIPNELPAQKSGDTNWSASQDRAEDLAEQRDPFIQGPELNTQLPVELIQERAYQLYERRGRSDGLDVVDWLEAQQQLRRETALKQQTT